MRSNAPRLLPEFREFQRRNGAPSHFATSRLHPEMVSWSFLQPQAEIASLMEAARQHVLEETAPLRGGSGGKAAR
jgi:hypothetical protein